MPEELQSVQKLVDVLIEFLVNYSFQVMGALVVLIIGWLIAKYIANILNRMLEKRDFDVTLKRFLTGISRYVVFGFAVIIAMGKFGISIAPFIAALGAATLGLSFAIQGPVSNFGAGMVIILTRPFVVGDTITVAGVNGVVEHVALGFTRLIDEDGVNIVVPNRKICGEILQNSGPSHIVEATVGISYDDTPETAVSAVRSVLEANPDVVSDPAPQVGIQTFADSAIEIGYRYWVPTRKYFQVQYAVNQAVHTALADANITIPFPQQDVHIKKTDA